MKLLFSVWTYLLGNVKRITWIKWYPKCIHQTFENTTDLRSSNLEKPIRPTVFKYVQLCMWQVYVGLSSSAGEHYNIDLKRYSCCQNLVFRATPSSEPPVTARLTKKINWNISGFIFSLYVGDKTFKFPSIWTLGWINLLL